MATLRAAIREVVSTGGDREFLFTADGATHRLGALAERGEELRARLARSGLAEGDIVLLEFARADWPAFVSAYLGCVLGGFVPAVVSADAGTDRTVAVRGALPVRCHVTAGGPVWENPSAPRGDGTPAVEYLVTSGTTGTPAVVPVSDEARLAHRPRTSGVLALAAPPGTNAAQTALAEALLGPRGGLAVLDRWSPERFAELVGRSGATGALLAPAMALSLVRGQATSLEGLRLIRLGMAPASAFLVEMLAQRFPSATVTNVYTTTEAWPAGTVMRHGRDSVESVGRPLPGTRVRVTGPDGEALADGVEGRIELAYGEAGRWVPTGDIGRLAGGQLTFARREHDVVTRGGTVVSFTAVEEAILETGMAADVAVFRLGEGRDGSAEEFAAAIVWSEDEREQLLRLIVRERLGADAVPAAFYPVAEVPRDPQGKIRRSALAEATASERGRRRDAARNASEDLGEVGSALKEIWLDVLFREEVSAEDDFFLIGGDSLSAVICNTRIEERFGVTLPLEVHYESRTLTTLTTTLEKALSDV